MIEVYKGISRPKNGCAIPPRNDFTGALESHGQNLERLLLKPYFDAIAAKLTGAKVGFKGSEAMTSLIGFSGTCNNLRTAVPSTKRFLVRISFGKISVACSPSI